MVPTVKYISVEPGQRSASTMLVKYCAGCYRPIVDRFPLRPGGLSWHTSCVRCSLCSTSMTDRCFVKDGKFYCPDDFFRVFGVQSTSSNVQALPVHDDVTQSIHNQLNQQYNGFKTFQALPDHEQSTTVMSCYVNDNGGVCSADGMQIGDGVYESKQDKDPRPGGNVDFAFVNDATNDFNGPCAGGDADDSQLMSPHGSSNENSESDERSIFDAISSRSTSSAWMSEQGAPAGGVQTTGKQRGPRTTITSSQLNALVAAFAETPKPSRQARERLAARTGLTMRVVQVWFQNRRSKERRLRMLCNWQSRRTLFSRQRRYADDAPPASVLSNDDSYIKDTLTFLGSRPDCRFGDYSCITGHCCAAGQFFGQPAVN